MSKRSRRMARRKHADRAAKSRPRPNKRLAAAFRAAVDPHQCKLYNYDGSTMDNKPWPGFGFMCPVCQKATASAWHFWVTPSIAVCQVCATKLLDGEIQDHDIAQEFNFYTGKHDCVSCAGCTLKAAMDEEQKNGT